MPALYAHLRFGEEVANALSPALQQLLQTHTGTFLLGTQGPDILFYHKPMKTNELRSFGRQLHRKTGGEIFSDQAKKITKTKEENEQSELLAYVCGFICHFTLDVFCHPYIDGNSSDKLSHGKIESEFDKYVLRKDGKKIRGYNTASPIPKKDEKTVRACAKSLGVPNEAIALSTKTIRKINRMFSFPFEPFHWIAHGFLKLVKMERKFGDMFLHRKDDPLAKGICEELFSKWQSAIPTATALVENFYQAVVNKTQPDFTNELYRYNFSGIKFTDEQ